MKHKVLARLTQSGVFQGTSVVMSTRGPSEGTRVAGASNSVGDRLLDPSQAGSSLRE